MLICNKISGLIIALCIASILPAQEEGFRKQAPKSGPAPAIEMGEYEEFTLDNGLQVIVVENHKLPRVSFQLLVDVPLIKEGAVAGAAELAGEMMSRGTTTRSKVEIDQAIDYIGATFNTDKEGMYGASLTRHQDQLLEIMADVLLNPAFSEEEFEKLQSQRLSQQALIQSNANTIASNVGTTLRFDHHPYGEMITKESLQAITVDTCKAYYATYFKPNISYLAIVGDISADEAKEAAKKYFGSWEKGEIIKSFYTRPIAPQESEINFVDKSGAVQSVINITYPINLKPGSDDVIKASLMNTLLGGGMLNSRLNKNIREDKGYSYGVRSSLSYDKYIGYFTAGGSVRNEVTDSAIVAFLSEMKRLREEEVSEEELNSVKSYIYGSFARSLEQPQTIARYALNTVRYKLPENYYPDYLKIMSTITTEEVKTMAEKYLLPDRAHIVVVGNKAEVAEKLQALDSTWKVKFHDVNGKLIQDIDHAIPEGVTAKTVIEDYLTTIGGRDRLEQVQTMTMMMSTSVQGMAMKMTMMKKVPEKMLMKVDMNGMIVNETRFNGKSGFMSAMGQKQLFEEEDTEDMKMQASIFPELDYLKEEYKSEIVGIELLEGNKAYEIKITSPGGKELTVYYDQASSLKLKTLVRQISPQGTGDITISTTFTDYQTVEGITLPFEMVSEGMAPFPVNMKVEDVTFDTALEDDLFEIE
jgi:zinc protease